MLLRRLRLVNYGGIYNGMGLYEIDIDFTKCRNRIVMIKGDNGSGKSTIEGALKPLPDDNTSFINGMDASKTIEYYDELTGDIYSILFTHEVKSNGRTTKGYIKKNGVELNPSGNITGCKDVIFDEFQLDPNYITLIQLSSNKRGIADMRPADRKRYVNSILSTTEVYNDMYKKLSKKASSYKSMMGNMVAKLNTIGNEGQLRQELEVTTTSIRNLESSIESMYTNKGNLISKIEALDPDGSKFNKLTQVREELKTAKSNEKNARDSFDRLKNRYPHIVSTTITGKDIESTITQLTESNIRYEHEIEDIRKMNESILNRRQSEALELSNKTSKLQSFDTDGLTNLRELRKELVSNMDAIRSVWSSVIDIDKSTLTTDDFIHAYEAMKTMNSLIDDIGVDNVLTDNLHDVEVSAYSVINEESEKIKEYEVKIAKLEAYNDTLRVLDNRPSDCKIDSCPFISDTIKKKDELTQYVKTLKNNDFDTLSKCIALSKSRKSKAEDTLNLVKCNKPIYETYLTHNLELSALGLNSYTKCVESLMSVSVFKLFTKLFDYVNDINEYHSIKENLIEVDSKLKSMSTQEEMINMITSDIEKINKKIDDSTKEIDANNMKVSKLQSMIVDNTASIDVYRMYLDKLTTLSNANSEVCSLTDDYNTIVNETKQLDTLNDMLLKLDASLKQAKEDLLPLKNNKESIEYKLTVGTEYKKELAEYRDMYQKIETLKYYSSPTTGIQMVFINMYLSKILDNANRLLAGLFNGIFALLPLVITESEFRIPVAVNGGINHDDITSMSSAQISLISMIISIAMLSQTSTRLNIIVGDEIDAPFDSENRRGFINILYQLMSLVNSSQCVLISHNSEIPMNDCDIILLRHENDIITEGNVIWSYN